MDNKFLGIWASRVYAILLVLTVATLAFYALITPHTHSVTISTPSLATFEKLHSTYQDTLSCPCTKFETSNSNITILSPPRFHQVSSNYL